MPAHDPADIALERLVISVLLIPSLLFGLVCWTLIGWRSIRRLGEALEDTGRNLQEYHW